MQGPTKWKPDWEATKRHLSSWWDRKGLVVNIASPARKPRENFPPMPKPADPQAFHMDPHYQVGDALHQLSREALLGDNFPMFLPFCGPGSLGTFLGATPHFSFETVWYEPCIGDPESYGPIRRFDPRNNPWWDAHLAKIDEAKKYAAGRFIIGMPDLIENLDVLAALRGSEHVLMDLIERPAWVHKSLEEINEAFFAAFDALDDLIGVDGGNGFCFGLWGPGRTAKVQCDLCCMLSPGMFREFVMPSLSAQCQWLDYSMYHLDGETALQHLDALLEIEALDAIEWTPMGASVRDPSRPRGGSPHWYDMYRRIKRAGKSVQVIGVEEAEVIPLIEAVGPEGLYIFTSLDAPAAEKLAEKLKQYQTA